MKNNLLKSVILSVILLLGANSVWGASPIYSIGDVYITGTMNGWSTNNANWKLGSGNHCQKTFYVAEDDNNYTFKLYLKSGYYTVNNYWFKKDYSGPAYSLSTSGDNMQIETKHIDASSGYVKLDFDFWGEYSGDSKLSVTQSAVSVLSPSLNATSTALTAGGTSTLTASCSGGSGGYTYSYKVICDGNDVTNSTLNTTSGSSVKFTAPTVTGNKTYTITVTAKDSHALLSGLATKTATQTIKVHETHYVLRGSINATSDPKGGMAGWDATNNSAYTVTTNGSTITFVANLTNAKTQYKFKIYNCFDDAYYGQTGNAEIPNNTLWTLNGSNDVKFTTTAAGPYTFIYNTSDKSIKVQYPTAYTVKFSRTPTTAADVPTSSISSGAYVLANTSLTFTAKTAKTGYTWKGWYDNNAGTGNALSTNLAYTRSIDGPTTIYAVYTANTYTVKFDANGGSGNMSSQNFTCGTAQNLTANTFTRTGYSFAGWNTVANGSGTSYDDEEEVNNLTTKNGETITLYAQWRPNVSITGTYHFFPGERINLNIATPNDVTFTYQWQKLVGSVWTDISGATATTYTKVEAKEEDAGHYRCVVSSEGYCDAIAGYNVKCLQLNVYYNDHKLAFTTPLDKVDATTAVKSVNLENRNYQYYFEITDGCENFYGFNGHIHSDWYKNVTLNSATHCGLQTTKYGTYIFTIDHSYLTDDTKSYPIVSVTYPPALQEADKVIYWDNSVLKWNGDGTNKIYYRIGHDRIVSEQQGHNNNILMTLVPGTANLYKVTTHEYDNFEVWHIANNGGWSGEGNSIYKTKTEDNWAITQAMAFETLPVTSSVVTVTPTTSIGNGVEDRNNNCEFFKYDITEGMKTWNATVNSTTNGTITVSYTDHDGTAKSDFTSGDRDLAHTCLLTINATPAEGYSLATLTVNDQPFTSGTPYTLTENATIEATFTINTYTATWKLNGGQWKEGGTDDRVNNHNYGTDITKPDDPSRTGYTFAGWSPAEIPATMPDHDLVYTAQWTANTYTITLDQQGATTPGTTTVDATYGSALPSIAENLPTKTGYKFGGYFTSENGEGTQYYNQEGTAYYNKEWDIASTATLYAKWTPHEFTVKFNANGGDGSMEEQPFTYDIEQALSANRFTRVGYSFAGWNDKANGSGASYADQQVVKNLTATENGEKTLYAQWDAIHTVTWMVNGSQAEGDPTTSVVNGQTITTLPTTPDVDCNGKVFVGWTTATIHGETATIPDPLYTELGDFPAVTSNMTFYAVFAKGEGDNKWIETSIDKIGDTDEVVVTMTNGVTTWALNKTLSGQNYPLAQVVEGIDGVELPSTEVATEIIWNIGGNSTDGYVFYPKGQTAEWLYCTKSGIVKVGKTTTNRFTIVDGFLKHTNLEALWEGYLAVSSANIPDWRMYQSSQGVVAGKAQTLKFYKKTIVYTSYTNYSTSCMAGVCDITNANPIYVTSAVGQKIKAVDKLVLTTTDMAVGSEISLSAPNITFYKEGKEIPQLTTTAASETFELEIAYKPTIANTTEQPTITLEILGYQFAFDNKITGRSLPESFAIVAKVGNIWYALPSQGLNSETTPVGYPVEVDNNDNPTAVTAVPANADWSLRQVYASSGSNDRFTAYGDNLVFVNAENKTLYASKDNANIQTYAEYSNYAATNPGLYEWTPTTTDRETYTLTNAQRTDRTLNVATNTVFGVHSDNKATTEVRFLPITGRYTPLALQVVEWKENSIVVMYNGDPSQTASVSVNGGSVQTTELSGDGVQKDIAVYELTANGLATNPTQQLSITIGSEKVILPIPYIISGEKTDLALLPGDATVAARQEVAKVADLVVLKDAKLTADGAKGNPYKFRNVTIYGGGKLVIPSDKGFGVASLTLRAGGITNAGEYDYVYPQFELRGTFTNTAGKFYYDYITDYDQWYHLVLPFAADITTITYPTEFYGTNVTADNTGSWVIKRYAGEIRATGNYNAWKDIEAEGKTATSAGKGYIFWGAPKKVSVNGGTKVRQKWGIQRITMPITAGNAIDAENDKEGGKTISDLGSYENIANNSGKPNDQGWNLIGNPYMVNLTDMSTSGLHACKLVEVIDPATGKWNGKWDWNDETNIRYLTIPSEHFDTYTAKTVTQAVPLVPGRAFFVQLEGEANGVTFSAANRASLMPQHLAAQNTVVEIETGIILSSETMQDEMNFWIKDGKTNDYEYNADYPKTPNNTNFNIYGVHINGSLSWVATGPEYAEESMPIGYQVPAAGTYTLSISETYYSDILDALYVTDHAMSPELTVDLMNAPYEFSVNQAETNNERFTVSVRLKSENQGPTTGLENTGVQRDGTIKFIYQDKMFILHHGKIYDATGKQIITINK